MSFIICQLELVSLPFIKRVNVCKGIRIPVKMESWNPESNARNLESNDRKPESKAWNPESTFVDPDSTFGDQESTFGDHESSGRNTKSDSALHSFT